jgi:hypothetical protein
MGNRCWLFVLIAFGLAAQKPADPITDRQRYELASAQRDYLAAKQQYEAAVKTLKEKRAEVEKACGAAGFDDAQFACKGK